MGFHMVSVHQIVIQDQLQYNGETLLTYKIEYPEFHAPCYQMCLRKVNQFYKNKAIAFQKYCETELFKMAIEQYKEAIENEFPIRMFDAMLGYEVTYLCACVISVYFDHYEYTGGAHGNTIRESQTWNLRNCRFIKLAQLVRCLPDNKAYILKAVASQIEKDPDIYFENHRELSEQTFNENQFYCMLEGIVIYYQQYDIAPYSSGIREFLLPYTDCVLNPKKQCCMS